MFITVLIVKSHLLQKQSFYSLTDRYHFDFIKRIKLLSSSSCFLFSIVCKHWCHLVFDAQLSANLNSHLKLLAMLLILISIIFNPSQAPY